MQRKEKIHIIYLALGTNLGDKEQNMIDVLAKIEERIGKVIASSAFYITEPVGFESDNQFINSACCIETELKPLELLRVTKDIEMTMGRLTKSANGVHTDRLMDIDILLYDNLILEHPDLVLPHPHLHERAFVLHPLVEIAREVFHPTLHKTIEELDKSL